MFNAPIFNTNSKYCDNVMCMYNVYAKIFIPAFSKLLHGWVYVYNAGHLVDIPLNYSLAGKKFSSSLLSVHDVSLTSCHGTVHSDIVYGSDNFQTGYSRSHLLVFLFLFLFMITNNIRLLVMILLIIHFVVNLVIYFVVLIQFFKLILIL